MAKYIIVIWFVMLNSRKRKKAFAPIAGLSSDRIRNAMYESGALLPHLSSDHDKKTNKNSAEETTETKLSKFVSRMNFEWFGRVWQMCVRLCWRHMLAFAHI